MKHIAFAVVAAAALAVIGPRISQGHPRPKEPTAQATSVRLDYRAPPARSQAEPMREFPGTRHIHY